MTKKSLFLFLQPPPYPGYLNEHHEYKVCFGGRFLYRPGWLFTGPALCNWRFPARPEFIPSHKSFGSHPGVTVSAPTKSLDPSPERLRSFPGDHNTCSTPCLMLPSPHIWRLRLCRYFHGLPFTPRQTHTLFSSLLSFPLSLSFLPLPLLLFLSQTHGSSSAIPATSSPDPIISHSLPLITGLISAIPHRRRPCLSVRALADVAPGPLCPADLGFQLLYSFSTPPSIPLEPTKDLLTHLGSLSTPPRTSRATDPPAGIRSPLIRVLPLIPRYLLRAKNWNPNHDDAPLPPAATTFAATFRSTNRYNKAAFHRLCPLNEGIYHPTYRIDTSHATPPASLLAATEDPATFSLPGKKGIGGEEEGKGGRATKEDAGEKEWATGRKREKRRDLTGINWIQKLARTSTILISPAKKTNGKNKCINQTATTRNHAL
ncbi:hypothetical protein C7M84_023754 [Penaeus vannamei]|uniref:Uncharacterized protein n=1 Tax=Penaeus vannamei TaxID=6689 RepID=A0A3R7QYA9_PENVA|nr:hypothetical protein C7M84_023754 [Penaeus vannamei]